MLQAMLIAAFVASVVTLYLIRSSHLHARGSGDHDFRGPQKFHARVVPRIGGIGIVVAYVAAMAFVGWRHRGWLEMVLNLLVCSLPAFAAGLTEDFTKRVSARLRLIATAISAALGGWLLDATIVRTDIPGLDWIASHPVGGILLAVFVVAGVANSVNIIDGMNGLASMCVVLMLSGLVYVAVQVGDMTLAAFGIAAVGAVLGFFLWNYPNGLIFLGDGGAYFLGFVLAELGILLLYRNSAVSPLCPLMICFYPVWETIFSMYRRRVIRKRPMGAPDGIHLHSLIYRRLMRWAVGSQDAAMLTKRNSMTAPYLWIMCAVSIVPATLWWDNTAALAASMLLFSLVYLILYWRIVTFRTPRWLIVRHSALEE